MTEELTDQAAPPATACGFVALIGAPNVGKSTLVNALVGSKVTIVSRKVQTTRALIRGIVVENNAQIILVDTPGSDSLDSGARHTNCGDANCCLRSVYDATGLALGRVRLGLCAGVVPAQ